ncbi:MAG: phage portal protein [Acidimicrobiales bacterium]
MRGRDLARRMLGMEGRSDDTSPAGLFGPRDGRGTYAGVRVDSETAMRHSAVWAAVNLLARTVSRMPVDVYQTTTEGRRVEIVPPAIVSRPDPAPQITARLWRRQVMVSWLLRGNAYGWVVAEDRNGWPAKVEILNPDRVGANWFGEGPVTWRVNGREARLWQEGGQLLAWPAYVSPGCPIGLSPIRFAAESIGLGLAAQEFGARFFGDGAHPTSAVTLDTPTVTDEQAKIVKQRVLDSMNGTREPIVLGSGAKFAQLQIAPDESQFLETIGANVADVARWFGVAPEMVGGSSGDSNTYSNVESQQVGFLVFSVDDWAVQIEDLLTELIPPAQYVRLNPGALLRTTTKSRYEAHKLGLDAGWLLPDEVRALEDRDPLPGGVGQQPNWPPKTPTARAPGGAQ